MAASRVGHIDDEDTEDDAEGGPRAVTAWSADSTAIVRRWPEITLTARTPEPQIHNKKENLRGVWGEPPRPAAGATRHLRCVTGRLSRAELRTGPLVIEDDGRESFRKSGPTSQTGRYVTRCSKTCCRGWKPHICCK